MIVVRHKWFRNSELSIGGHTFKVGPDGVLNPTPPAEQVWGRLAHMAEFAITEVPDPKPPPPPAPPAPEPEAEAADAPKVSAKPPKKKPARKPAAKKKSTTKKKG